VSKGLQFRGGINNLFDKDPPVVDSAGYSISGPPFGNGNTYPGVYDVLGRTMYVALTAKL
jgi:outer membrane receptor protein involved in Fe transport